jgi:Flp pilus assembly CpaF family ATPase
VVPIILNQKIDDVKNGSVVKKGSIKIKFLTTFFAKPKVTDIKINNQYQMFVKNNNNIVQTQLKTHLLMILSFVRLILLQYQGARSKQGTPGAHSPHPEQDETGDLGRGQAVAEEDCLASQR